VIKNATFTCLTCHEVIKGTREEEKCSECGHILKRAKGAALHSKVTGHLTFSFPSKDFV